jgi:tryptophan synthase beta subunit
MLDAGLIVAIAITTMILLAVPYRFRIFEWLRRFVPPAPPAPPVPPPVAAPEPASPVAPVAADTGPRTEELPAQPPRTDRDTLPLGTAVPRLKPKHRPLLPRTDEGIQVREPLVDADTTQAAGFYREIAELLTAQLESDPGRLDLHRTLLEVFRAAGHVEDYVRYARMYYERSLGSADPHWEGIAHAGRELVPGHGLFEEDPQTHTPKKFQRFYETVGQTRLHAALREVSTSYEEARRDPAFIDELQKAMADSARRPTPLAAMPLASADGPGATIYAKREDQRLANDDQLINAIGQTLLALRLGRKAVVTATRDGIHGLAVASVAGRHGVKCTVYMAEPAYCRHFGRVLQMQRLGAEVRTVAPAPQVDTAWQAALQGWLNDVANLHYISSLESGPHPFPLIVRDFQSVVGQEAMAQLRAATGGAPAAVVAGVADNYIGLGLLNAFLAEDKVALYCVEPPTEADKRSGKYLREHNWLQATRRVQYVTASDDEAMQMVEALFRSTGMCIATEAARTLAYARRLAAAADPGHSVLTLISTPEERPIAPS